MARSSGSLQLGYGTETVRKWVKVADIDEGVKPGRSTADAAKIKEPEAQVKELKRANEILRKASAILPRRSSTARERACRVHRRAP